MQNMSQLVHKPSTSNDYTASSVINVNNYDSVSMFSGTSTVDSEFMASKIKTFESERETTFTTETSNNQINLQISVINTGKHCFSAVIFIISDKLDISKAGRLL